MKQCNTCRHFQEMPNGNECRRHPPTIIDAFVAKGLTDEDHPLVWIVQGATCWPFVDPIDHCGEWSGDEPKSWATQ